MQKKKNRHVQVPCKKNDIVRITIRDIGSGGEGIGFLQITQKEQPGSSGKGFAIFVKDTVPGEMIEAVITKVTAHYAYGHLNRILMPSPDRVEPLCPIAKRCGGCQIQALSYVKQLAFKQKKVRESLIRIGGFSPDTVDAVMHPIVGMEKPWRYRNKEQVPVQQGKYGPVTGFYAIHSHTVIPMTDCLIGSPLNRRILETILSWMQEYGVPAYDETTGKGLIRHILIRDGIYSGQIMVCVIANDYRLPFEKELVQALRGLQFVQIEEKEEEKEEQKKQKEKKEITSIVLNTNTERTNVITGRTLRTLWGKDEIEDTLHIHEVYEAADNQVNGYISCPALLPPDCPGGEGLSGAELIKTDLSETESNRIGSEKPQFQKTLFQKSLFQRTLFQKTEESVTFGISPLSFYQVNPRQTEKLYSLALSCAGLTGSEIVWDLYCGVGTISLFMARRAKQVYGVEVIPEAIENARRNAEKNDIRNAEFYVGKAEEVLPAYVENLKRQGKDPQIDVICVDPPRKGCDDVCIRTMLEIAPKRIVYVSCDPATLARDLKKFAEGGYTLDYVQPVDQFAHTVHVESIALLERVSNQKADAKVHIDVDLEDYYRIKDAQGKDGK